MNEAEERFRLLFEGSNDPVLLIDEYRFVDCNDRALEIMRCVSKERLIGLHPFSISPGLQPDGRFSSEKDRELIDVALAGGTNHFLWEHRTFGGDKLLTEVSLVAIPYKGRKVIHTTWKDITREKQLEESLQAQTERFLAIVDNAPFAAALVDANGKWTYVNARFRELSGYDLYDIPDEDTWFLTAYPDPDYRATILEERGREVERFRSDPSLREGREFTFTVTCKDKSRKAIRIIPVRLPSGGYLKTFINVTEKEGMKEGLMRAQARLVMKSAQLRGVNAALKALLKSRHDDRLEMELSLTDNINKLVLPFIGELKKSHLDDHCAACIEMIEQNIRNVVSPFLHDLTTRHADLTVREMQIIDLLKNGKTTKEIARTLRTSPSAVNFHRNNIRKKLGIANQKVNLQTFLSRDPRSE
ncbi:MAG: DNA-binding transcriptional activator UhpA [Syntrophorhabdus sp. PtaB.Bin184]|nr:MAG: DNA-binding transcriptional activator UhpA [Syntrophorhabdus sp. PtaB.Bin184]